MKQRPGMMILWQKPTSATGLLDAAVALLRVGGTSALLAYLVGTLPFLLGLLYFWGDMSRSRFAHSELLAASLAMAVGLVWMKSWQAVFVGRLQRVLVGDSGQPRSLVQIVRMVVTQGLGHAFGLYLLILSVLLVFPLVWVYPFLQNVTVACDGRIGLAEGLRRSWRQAGDDIGMNFRLLTLVSGLLLPLLIANVILAMLLIPILLSWLLGLDTSLSRAWQSVLTDQMALLRWMGNTTFLAAVGAVCYLMLDPVLKAAYTIRAFHGQARASGRDLLAQLRWLRDQGRSVAAGIVVLAAVLVAASPVRAQSQAAGGVAPVVSATETPPPPQRLDEAIDKTVRQRKYSWRIPRPEGEAGEPETPGFLQDMANWLDERMKALREWLEGEEDPQEEIYEPTEPEIGGEGPNLQGPLKFATFALVGLAIAAGVYFLVRYLRDRTPREDKAEAEELAADIDVADESIVASQLPEDGWMRMARELIDKGDYRLALRAMYLACLAYLGDREFLMIAKFKSNRDYQRELLRRGHSYPEVVDAFSESVGDFENAWYGMHEVTRETLERTMQNHRRIHEHA